MYKERREAIHGRRNNLNPSLKTDEFKIYLNRCINVPRKKLYREIRITSQFTNTCKMHMASKILY